MNQFQWKLSQICREIDKPRLYNIVKQWPNGFTKVVGIGFTADQLPGAMHNLFKAKQTEDGEITYRAILQGDEVEMLKAA